MEKLMENEKKVIAVSSEAHQKLKVFSVQHKMTMSESLVWMLDYMDRLAPEKKPNFPLG